MCPTRSTARRASSVATTFSSRSANSSPPMRAIVSAWRTDACKARGDLLQDLVTRRVPERVVHGLEVVQVDEHHRQGPVVASLAFKCVIQAVGEKDPVHETCQGVVERLTCQVDLAGFELCDRGLELAVQSAVLEQSLELTRHDESGGRGADPEQDPADRVPGRLYDRGGDAGERERNVRHHQLGRRLALQAGLDGRLMAGRQSGQADEQESGNPPGVQPVAVAVGAVLRQVSEHAVGDGKRDDPCCEEHELAAVGTANPCQRDERHGGGDHVPHRIREAHHASGRALAARVERHAESGCPTDEQERARDDRTV